MSAAAIMLMSSLDHEKTALFFEKVSNLFPLRLLSLVFVTCC